MISVLAATSPPITVEEELLLQEILEEAARDEAEAARHGMTVDEWKKHLADLCEDAVVRGD